MLFCHLWLPWSSTVSEILPLRFSIFLGAVGSIFLAESFPFLSDKLLAFFPPPFMRFLVIHFREVKENWPCSFCCFSKQQRLDDVHCPSLALAFAINYWPLLKLRPLVVRSWFLRRCTLYLVLCTLRAVVSVRQTTRRQESAACVRRGPSCDQF